MKTAGAFLFLVTTLSTATLVAQTPNAEPAAWSPQTAAAYLDGRFEWWSTWSSSQRDHETFCISCHTVLPYALGRRALRGALRENGPSGPETLLVANISKRVRLWKEVQPFYPDSPKSPGKTRESRGTESILNALALAANEAPAPDVTLALDNMLTEQLTSGDDAGAWPWLQFHNAPWEGDSTYFGATLAALALGTAPRDYLDRPTAQSAIRRLRLYLREQRDRQTPMDRVFLLWASVRLPGLLTAGEQKTIADESLSRQRPDGGFSLSAFVGNWKRKDNTPLETKSDGYATGVVTFVLGQAGMNPPDGSLRRGLSWLATHQRPAGDWPAWSLNKDRDPASDAGRFMNDAATGFAALALAGKK